MVFGLFRNRCRRASVAGSEGGVAHAACLPLGLPPSAHGNAVVRQEIRIRRRELRLSYLFGLHGVQKMKKIPNAIDREIGKRIKSRRLFLGHNQQFLAESIGVSYQQVQKYENGTDRVGASRLYAIANSLDVPIGFFYGAEASAASGLSPDAEQENQIVQRTMATEEARSLILSFGRIRDPELRAKVLDLAELLADAKLTGKTRAAPRARSST